MHTLTLTYFAHGSRRSSRVGASFPVGQSELTVNPVAASATVQLGLGLYHRAISLDSCTGSLILVQRECLRARSVGHDECSGKQWLID